MVFATVLTLLVAGVLLHPVTQTGEGGSVPSAHTIDQRTPMRTASSAQRLRKFLKFLVKVEGLPRGDKRFPLTASPDKFFPYKDPAGLWTIGYGHLIGDGSSPEGFEQGLTKQEVNVFLARDAATSMKQARSAVGEEAWSQIDERRRYMLTDFAFNLGPEFNKKVMSSGRLGFPKFTAAVLSGDDETARRESKRFFTDPSTKEKVPLGRNKDFEELAFGGADIPADVPDPEADSATPPTLTITPTKPAVPKGQQVLDLGNREIPNVRPSSDNNP
jgi:GH24 family phage-related lysozyme (muramidase)